MIMISVGSRITELRKKMNLTQEDFAKKIGISRSALSHYEKDRREPDYETIRNISNVCDVTTDYLLGKTDNPNKSSTSETNRAFNNFDDITDQEKDYLEEQLRIFRKLRDNK
ncbi:hypothetical protein Pryu01_03096 [Paraliobacillus ryukyuensis]|uniref:Transcriptional regulator with XRE-family HTH domain n=2 Tax=Paraliobacillus ryukyuensis TaxID=200904 RepID=A0A366DMY8_9BACI|nr:transcriptional regulator with XRE-family HTH domain [Paraliobacillus ryukyuensis]